MDKCEGSVQYLKLIRSVLIAYIKEDTEVAERIFNAVYVVYFIRNWRQWLHESKVSTKHFLTLNSWEGLEINLVLLVKMVLLNKSENIYLWNSQIVESFFRQLRSYTGIESTIVSCTVKEFTSRVNKMQIEEILMQELSRRHDLKFPKIIQREKILNKQKANLSLERINEIFLQAMDSAAQDSSKLGMNCNSLTPENFLKPVTVSVRDAVFEDSAEKNYLDTQMLTGFSQNREDSDCSDIQENLTLQNITFLDDRSGKTFELKKYFLLSDVSYRWINFEGVS